MSTPYDLVRRALEATPLEDGGIDSVNASLRLTPDSPEWTIAVLTRVGMLSALPEFEKRFADQRQDADALRLELKTSVETVKQIADAVSGKTDAIVQPIVDKTSAALVEHLNAATDVMQKHSAAQVAETQRRALLANMRIEFSSMLYAYVIVPLFIVVVIALAPWTRAAEIHVAYAQGVSRGIPLGKATQLTADQKAYAPYYDFSIRHGGPR